MVGHCAGSIYLSPSYSLLGLFYILFYNPQEGSQLWVLSMVLKGTCCPPRR